MHRRPAAFPDSGSSGVMAVSASLPLRASSGVRPDSLTPGGANRRAENRPAEPGEAASSSGDGAFGVRDHLTGPIRPTAAGAGTRSSRTPGSPVAPWVMIALLSVVATSRRSVLCPTCSRLVTSRGASPATGGTSAPRPLIQTRSRAAEGARVEEHASPAPQPTTGDPDPCGVGPGTRLAASSAISSQASSAGNVTSMRESPVGAVVVATSRHGPGPRAASAASGKTTRRRRPSLSLAGRRPPLQVAQHEPRADDARRSALVVAMLPAAAARRSNDEQRGVPRAERERQGDAATASDGFRRPRDRPLQRSICAGAPAVANRSALARAEWSRCRGTTRRRRRCGAGPGRSPSTGAGLKSGPTASARNRASSAAGLLAVRTLREPPQTPNRRPDRDVLAPRILEADAGAGARP